MEFYIRPFLNRWPAETLTRLGLWAEDENYHVRRLVSEGTRPKLPWAKAVALTPAQTVPLLDALHADPTRYVSRSVANHMNDLSKSHPDLVLDRLRDWQGAARQDARELDWMTRHSLRTLVKQGHPGALEALGYRAEADVLAVLQLDTPRIRLGDAVTFRCRIEASEPTPILVDYRIRFARPGGATAEKVFKLRQGETRPGKPFQVTKLHKLKADATTFNLHRGTHALILQVNGVDRAEACFEIV
jgi:3-methyladenine DNA glycosylase AlkC